MLVEEGDERAIDWDRLIAKEKRWQRKESTRKNPAPNAGKRRAVEEEDDDDDGDEIYPCLEDSRSWDFDHEKVENEDKLAAIWHDWDAEIEAERRRVPDLIKFKDIDVLIDSCDHEFVFREDCGKVCEICGRVVKLVSDVFDIPVPARKASSRPATKKLKLHEDYAWKSTLNFGDITVDLVPHPMDSARMYPHQREAFIFISRNLLSKEPGGVILHHAPGTGKTFLVISFLTSFFANFQSARAMILAPKGMLLRWEEEFHKWEVASLPVYILDGDSDIKVYKWATERSVLIMTPQLLASKLAGGQGEEGDESWLLARAADVLVFDEAHYARNDNTRIAEALKTVRTPRRIFLSGTVFQNNLDELYNLFTLCRPSFLTPVLERFEFDASKDDAERHFFKEMIENRLENNLGAAVRFFRKLTAPFLHWHGGKVLDSLPGIEEVLVTLNLTEAHKALVLNAGKSYTKEKKRGFLAEDSRLARACVHPCFAVDVESPQLEQQDPKAGAKTAFVMELLRFLRNKPEKLIIFGQYRQPLELLKNMIMERLGWRELHEVLYMSGETATNERVRISSTFNSKSSTARVILVSIKACGEGISLVGGSRVVVLDTAWNPSTVRQAVSRAFRIGQKKKVYVYRLLVGNTLEHEVEKLRRSMRKDFLAMALFHTEVTPEDLARKAGLKQELAPVEDTQDAFLKPFLLEGSDIKYRCDGVYRVPRGLDEVCAA
ncbi:protein CHROMATIN REMODELING 35 [Selaginella moellendorffii]|nr:protein CHROMATIN REMODELING 35 [Selaginella moellendorffii]|eukprot:XP_002983106.2 protein CHROMATIN REMODELING 35 [Selaginella moellendorffii]